MPPSPGFTDEARENVQALQEAVLRIEGGAGGEADVAGAFRAAHNLKGMAAMEGIDPLRDLAHALENVLDECRNGTRPADAGVTDLLLEGIDLLGDLVETAEADEPPPAITDVLAKLSATIVPTDTPPSSAPGSPPAGDEHPPSGTTGVVEVQLLDSCGLPGARALVVQRIARQHAEVLGMLPVIELIRSQSHRKFSVAVGQCPDPDALVAAVARAPEVEEAAWVLVQGEPPPDLRAPRAPATSSGGQASAATIRVDVSRLDLLADQVGELSIERNRLGVAFDDTGEGLPLAARNALVRLDRALSDLRTAVMGVRLVSLEPTVDRARRLIRDTARDLGKEVSFEVAGAKTEVDRSIVDELFAPIVHLLRNAVDHGIEPATTREAAGKPARGSVRLSAQHQGDQVVVEVADDGAGIDLERVARKAVRLGLLAADQVASATADDLHDLMFSAGFSTREEVSEISGRGVGLDVVRAQVDRLGGRLDVRSTAGVGTTFRVRLPLSLAAMDALLVEVDGARWAIPLNATREAVRIERLIGGVGAVPRSARHRGTLVPVIWAREELAGHPPVSPTAETAPHHVVIFEDLGSTFGLVVDDLIESRELIVKPAPARLRGGDHVSGVTLLPNGSVAPIVDLSVLGARWRRRNAAAAGVEAPAGGTAATTSQLPEERAFERAAHAFAELTGCDTVVERGHATGEAQPLHAAARWFRLVVIPSSEIALVLGFSGTAEILAHQGVPSPMHASVLAEWANIVASQFAVGGVERFGAGVAVGVPEMLDLPPRRAAQLEGRISAGDATVMIMLTDDR